MTQLLNTSQAEVTQIARGLFIEYRDHIHSFEAIAQALTQRIYEQFSPDIALARIFRVSKYAEIPADLASLADSSTSHWVILAGSYGDKPQWCGRANSVNHRIISAISSTPMIAAALQKSRIDVGSAQHAMIPDAKMIELGHYFYVPDAIGDERIPDQRNFVQPYGIRTVIGVGSRFLSGAAYLMVIFTKVLLDQDQVETLLSMTPFVSTMLAAQDGKGNLWA